MPLHERFWLTEAAHEDASRPAMLKRGEKCELPPALVFGGDKDEWVPVELMRSFVADYKKADGATVPSMRQRRHQPNHLDGTPGDPVICKKGGAGVAMQPARGAGKETEMNKFSCNMISGEEIFYATLIAEDAKQAREMAASETKKGRPREWNVAVIEKDVPGPARFLGTGVQEA